MCMQYAYVYMVTKWTKKEKQNSVELEHQNICENRVKNYTGD